MSPHDHEHLHVRPEEKRKVLLWSLLANGGFMVVEIVGGLLFGSLALLADAAHMASDVAALGIALIAQRLAQRPPSARHTFGMQRAEVIGAQVNALVLIGLAAFIVIEALERIDSPQEVDGGGLLLVALIGLGVNVGSAVAIRRKAGRDLNMRGAYLHMALDAVGSVGALAAGLFVLAGIEGADPIVSIAIAALVVYSSYRLLREAWHVLMEGTPPGLDPAKVRRVLLEDPSVEDVHHLHLWTISSGSVAMSAHVLLEGEMSLHDAQVHGDRIRGLLAERFAIDHCTLELECHPCDPVESSRG